MIPPLDDNALAELLRAISGSTQTRLTTEGPCGGWIGTVGAPYGYGEMHVADVRGWGHLTGGGACNMPAEKAAAIQDANGARLVLSWNAAPALAQEVLELRRLVRLAKDVLLEISEHDETTAWIQNRVARALERVGP